MTSRSATRSVLVAAFVLCTAAVAASYVGARSPAVSGGSLEGFPFEIESGDVLANRPVGVIREVESAIERHAVSRAVGVTRQAPPPQPLSRLATSHTLGVYRGAGMISVDPERITVGMDDQVITVEGFGLAAVTAAQVEPSEGLTLSAPTVGTAGESVTFEVDATAQAEPGLRRIRLIDDAGRVIPAVPPDAGQVLITAPRPVIHSIDPILVVRGQTHELVVRGEHLRGLPYQDRGLDDPEPDLSITPGDGIVVGEAVTSNPEGTVVTANVSVASDAALGERLVRIETRSDQSTDVDSSANTLTVIEAPPREFAPIASAPVGVTREVESPVAQSAFSRPLGVTRGPVILGFSPKAVLRGESAMLTIEGAELGATTAVGLEPADGITIDSGSLTVSESQVRVDVTVASGAPLFDRRLVLQTPDADRVAPGLLEIQDAPPEVHALTPTYLLRDGVVRTIDIQGDHLSQSQGAIVLPGEDIVIQDYTITSDDSATLTLLADPAAATGGRVVQILGINDDSSSAPAPANSLEIIDVAQVYSPVTSAALGVIRQTPGETESRALFSPPVGVVRGAHADALAPQSITRGASTALTVEGVGLDSVTDVLVESDDGLVLGDFELGSASETITLDVNVAADAIPGSRRVVLQTAAGRIPFVPPRAGIFVIDDNDPDAPETVPDSYPVVANRAVLVAESEGLLANDVSSQGELFAVLRTLPQHGSLSLESDGSFAYTPDPDFVGIDQFRYSAGNDQAVGDSATVSLVVEERNDAIADQYTTPDDAALVVGAAAGLLANDELVEGDTPIILIESQPQLGELSLQPDGGFQYVPHGAAGGDSFSYRLEVPEGTSIPAEVTIDVIPVNDPPSAVGDSYVVTVDEQLQVPSVNGVLRNDSDPDGDDLHVQVVANPSEGALALGTDGGFTYTPPDGFVGQVQFVYEVFDGAGLSDTATVVITVNNDLAPQDDFYSIDEGRLLAIPATEGVLINDSVISQGEARVILDQSTTEGSLDLMEDGSFLYEPESSDYAGSDQFTYFLQDDAVTSNTATVTLTINPVNDPPEAQDDEFITDENAELVVDAPGFLENDSDPDSTALAASLVSETSNGIVEMDTDGGFTYVPDVNYRGEDSFVYSLADDGGESDTGTVTIRVTQPPTATNDVYFVETDSVIEITDPEEGLLINDHDAPEDDVLTTIPSESPEHGVAMLNPDGTFSYVPDAGFQGIDTMTYRVTDGRSESNVATVTFPVGITSFPKAVPDSYTLEEEEEFFVPAEEGLLINDQDADTPLADLEADLVGVAELGRRPLDVVVNDDGSFTVRPWDDFFGETFFVYQVFDGTDISNAAIVTLEVLPVNDGIEAVDDEFGVVTNEVFESEPRGNGSIGFNDAYDGDYEVNWEIVSAPLNGTVEIDQATSVFRYTPDPDYAGSDQFTYRAWQVETGISDTAVVTMYTNAPPKAVDDFFEFDEDTMAEMLPPPIANDTDANGDELQYLRDDFYDRQVRLELDGIEATATVTLHPRRDFYGTNVSDYRITDGSQSDRGYIDMIVHPVPDNPETRDDDYLVQRNDRLIVNDPGAGVLGNDHDPDKRPSPNHPVWEAATGVDLEPLTAELLSDVVHGTLTFYDNGVFIYEPDADYSGTDSFTYRALDATGRFSETETVSIRVNSPAVAVDDAFVVNEDTELAVEAENGLLVNDSDPDGDDLWASRHYNGCAPCNGQVDIDPDGSFDYTPDPDFHGQDDFFYRVRDGVEGYDVGRVVVTVLPINDAPVTESDTYRTREDVILTAPEPQGTLRNDVELDGDGLADAEMLSGASNGSVAFQPDGSFTYTPDVDFNGRDTFTYRVYDTTGLPSGEELVEILVTPVNDAPSADDDEYQTDQDSALVVDADNGVIVNDADVDGPSLVAVMLSPPLHGQATLDADGAFEYEPDGVFTGTDHFIYQIGDGLGAVDSATVTIVVNAGEPDIEVTARNDFYQFEGPSTSSPSPGVLDNDSLEGDGELSASVVIPPEHGTVALDPDGSFSYEATPGYAGIDGFTYSASAGGVSDLARVTFDVMPTSNVPPVANDDDYSILEDTSLDSQQLGSVLGNDEDFEGATLTVELLSMPDSGQLDMGENGHFTYTPVAHFNGSVHFMYRASDGQDVSDPASVAIGVISRNDAPDTSDDAYQTATGEVLDVAASAGLLDNDSDVDGDPLSVTLVDTPDNGQVSVQSDGAFNYTPLPGFSGSDVFRYVASDSQAQSAASVFITVTSQENQPPTGVPDAYVVVEDALLDSQVAGSLLDNDTDPDGDSLVATLDELPAHGTLDFDSGHFTYQPDPDYNGSDSFSYRVSDGDFSDGPVGVQIEVAPVNDQPTARTDLYTTTQAQHLIIAQAHGVLSNDSDADDDPLTVSVETGPAQGNLILEPDGSFEYRPDPGFNGRDEFAYRVSDGLLGQTGRAVIDVTVSPNQRPNATGEVFDLPEDTVLDTRTVHGLLENDEDPEGAMLTLEPEALPSAGETELLPGGHMIFTPPRDAVGDFELRYRVSDGVLQSEAVSAVIRIQSQNDPPQAQSDVYLIAPDATELSIPASDGVLNNDVDVDGDSLAATLESTPQHGDVNFGLDGSFTYVPTAKPRRDSFTYSVADSMGEISTATVTLIVSEGSGVDVIFSDQFKDPEP